ncbi:DUF4870 domain-containing protein [Flavobacterium sp. J372]|uniref:DUF4870 domain-containing protein n=1 Tax=Flavobacterium sp. J372 TaxID=2898436 RepID=UPI002151B4FF|nr:DUF4870 domain-containing protein [Flavobacterium sp. J372]MCR5862933.1 DUF4870 domain-containing protein [Flavobacterium sp. J372]
METTANKNTATLIHLSALSQYFIPLGSIIFPVLIWSMRKNDSAFVDHNGKQAINFHLSLFVYTVIFLMLAVPFAVIGIINNINFSVSQGFEETIEHFAIGNIGTITFIGVIATALFAVFKIAEFILIIYAAVKNSNGQDYTYPFAIKFLK